MKEDGVGSIRRASGHLPTGPALHVVCLGSAGGPAEDNVTGFLVRSTATNWSKNSVLAVDAGSHLASITRILATNFPYYSQDTPPASKDGNGHSRYDDPNHESPSPRTANLSQSDEDSSYSTPPSEESEPTWTILEAGAFAGLPFPHKSARANALHVVREHVSTYLITHSHLDHVSGFVINTAAFHNTSRPKRFAALPSTVNDMKTHIFNNRLWPNLTDEDGGVGLVTFQRLAEGGNIALGEGGGRGYIEICDGLGVRGFKVSHGHCMSGPSHIHRGSNANPPETPNVNVQRASTHPYHDVPGDAREGRSLSFSYAPQSAPGTPLFSGMPDPARTASLGGAPSGGAGTSGPQFGPEQCVIDSTAYFIRTEATPTTPCKEVLMFGDVEPDSISLSPRTAIVWAEAAPKVAAGILGGIFIECSYTNAQDDAMLFGHLAPRHLLVELQNLADMVKEARREHEKEKEEARKGRKRKRASLLAGEESSTRRRSSRTREVRHDTDEEMADLVSPNALQTTHMTAQLAEKAPPTIQHAATVAAGQAMVPSSHGHHAPPAPAATKPTSVSAEHSRALLSVANDTAPLKGVKVVIIHVKDTMADGPPPGDAILRELIEGERVLAQQGKGLGCEFLISNSGDSYFF